jgi:signal peptidase II
MISGRLLVIALILPGVVAVDLGTKEVVRSTLAASSPQYYIGGLLRLSHWENAGTFMSLGNDLPEPVRLWMFTIAAGVFAAGLIIFISIGRLRLAPTIAGSLIVGGTMSNIIDRLLHDGRVLDFINIVITPLHLMIFNLADVAIGCGVLMLAALAARRSFHHGVCRLRDSPLFGPRTR